MPFVKKLTPIGTSTGLVIDKPFLRQFDLGPNSEVEISIQPNGILISPHRYADDATVAQVGRTLVQKRQRLMKRLAK